MQMTVTITMTEATVQIIPGTNNSSSDDSHSVFFLATFAITYKIGKEYSVTIFIRAFPSNWTKLAQLKNTRDGCWYMKLVIRLENQWYWIHFPPKFRSVFNLCSQRHKFVWLRKEKILVCFFSDSVKIWRPVDWNYFRCGIRSRKEEKAKFPFSVIRGFRTILEKRSSLMWFSQ